MGIRPGEKLHEEMISATDSINTIEFDKYYAVLPSVPLTYKKEEYLAHFNAKMVEDGFSYNSEKNQDWESVESLRKLIKEHINPDFEVV